MKKILFLAALGLLFAAGNADAKAVKLGKSDDGGARIAVAKEKRVKSVKCEKGQFKNSDGVCVGCTVANCAECKSAGVCKRCNAGYSLLNGETCGCASNAVCGDKEICENKVCVGVSCPDGYYASEHKCKACSSNCLTCSDQNTCTSCEPGKYLSGGSCNGCSAKFSNCLECDSTKCTKCDGETDKINGVCVEPGCKTSADCAGNQVCNASHECEECPEGYEKQGDSCVPEGSDPECTIDAECDENEKCSDEACVLKTCAEINASYKTSCSDNQTKTDTGVDGSDGACYSCKDPAPECSSDSNCGACQTCSSNKCVSVSCGAGQECDNNHGCKASCSQTCSGASDYASCPAGYACQGNCCKKCGLGSNRAKNGCNCYNNEISTGDGSCQGSTAGCYVMSSDIPNCSTTGTNSSCSYSAYKCTSCNSGYTLSNGSCSSSSSSGSNSGSSSHGCWEAPTCTTSGCQTRCCPSHGGGTCSSCHKEWGQGQYWYMCDSCSSGTRQREGSNYFYSCVK